MGSTADVLGIIAPHPPIMIAAVGGSESDATAASIDAMRRTAEVLAAFDPDTIVVISPHAPGSSHALVVETAPSLAGSLARFNAPEVAIRTTTDVQLARAVIDELSQADVAVLDRATDLRARPGELDHGVIVPLIFLDPEGTVPLVVLSQSGLSLSSHRRAGECIAAASARLGRRIIFLASGDLSHRLTRHAPAGYHPRAEEFDHTVVDLVSTSRLDLLDSLDPDLIERAGECGLRSFVALSGALPDASTTLLAYEAPFGVGYLTALVGDQQLLADPPVGPLSNCADGTPASGRKGGAAGHDGHPIVSLARSAIEAALHGDVLPEATLPSDPALPDRAGVFVTLHRQGALRGCIGTIDPTEPTLAEEVVANALKAATEDPRFPALTVVELADLDVKVDVLYPPEPAAKDDLDPSTYGVIVTAGWRRGLLLPDLDGVDTPEKQLFIARSKAGIAPAEDARIERFRVERYS